MNFPSNRQQCFSLQDHFIGSIVIFLSFIIYVKTLAPTIMWGDPAKLTVYAYRCFLTVCAENHLLRSLLGWLWGHLPFDDYAFGQNLLSAVFASLTNGIVYLIVLKLTKRRLAAIVAALALAVSHTFWWLAVMAESYSLLFLLITVCIFSALMWEETGKNKWLYFVSGAFGLGITDHAIMPLFAPAFVLHLLLVEPRFFLNWKRLGAMLLAFGFGMLPLVAVFVGWLQRETPERLIYLMSADPLVAYLEIAKFVREMLYYPAYLFYQFPVVGFILSLTGIWVLRKDNRNVFILLSSIILLDVIFSAAYMHARQFEIIVPSYLAFAIGIGIGFDHIWRKICWKVHTKSSLLLCRIALIGLPVLLPITAYYTIPSIIRHFDLNPLGIRYMPYRDNARYFLLPDKSGYYGADRFGREVLSMLPANAVILVDFSPGMILQYMQVVEGLRPDVKIIGVESPGSKGEKAVDAVEKYFGQRPIYFTDYHPYPWFFGIDQLSRDYAFIPRGNIYQVVKKDRGRLDTSVPNLGLGKVREKK